MPPKPVNVALQNARLHCPRMLFACDACQIHTRPIVAAGWGSGHTWYAIVAGTFAFAPAVARKTPKYRTEPLLANPRIGRPMRAMAQLKTMTAARMPVKRSQRRFS